MHLLDLAVEVLCANKAAAIVSTSQQVYFLFRNEAILYLTFLFSYAQVAADVFVRHSTHLKTFFAFVVRKRGSYLFLLSLNLADGALNATVINKICEFSGIHLTEKVFLYEVL